MIRTTPWEDDPGGNLQCKLDQTNSGGRRRSVKPLKRQQLRDTRPGTYLSTRLGHLASVKGLPLGGP